MPSAAARQKLGRIPAREAAGFAGGFGNRQAAQIGWRKLREPQVYEAEAVRLGSLLHDAALADAGRPPDHQAGFDAIANEAVEIS